jgi:hypothetical protein
MNGVAEGHEKAPPHGLLVPAGSSVLLSLLVMQQSDTALKSSDH